MITFIIGLVILIVGAAIYGSICERIMKPSASAKTPAIAKKDGVDYVPMNKWKNCLIELLNIAGTLYRLSSVKCCLYFLIHYLNLS